jgi:centromere protein I
MHRKAHLHLYHTVLTLIVASKLPARSRATNVGPFLDDVTEHAYHFGLSSDDLRRIVNVLVTKNELDQATRATLVRNLYPAERLPSSVVLAVVGSLGQGSGKPAAATQALLVRWIAAVHDVLEEPAFLLRLYGVLFNLLDLISIRYYNTYTLLMGRLLLTHHLL